MGKFAGAVRAALVAGLLCTPGAAWAETWDGSDSIDWDALANWVADDLPTDGNTITLDTTEGDPPFSPTIDSGTAGATTALPNSDLRIGQSSGSDANLTITNAGTLTTGFAILGVDDGAMGSVVVTGSGSQWSPSFPALGSKHTTTLAHAFANVNP